MEKVKLIHMSKNSEEQFRLFIWFIVERLQGVSYHLFCWMMTKIIFRISLNLKPDGSKKIKEIK